MRKYFKNKKMVTLMVSVLATTLILTGTFAWSVRLFSTTGGLGVDYNYLVKLLDEDSDPLFVNNNWKEGALAKKVYATSSYKDDDIATEYDEIMDDSPDAIFRDTWVRIKLEETFMRNGTTSTTTVTEMLGDTLKSSISDGKYFTFDKQATIKTIDNWNGEQGRFWILDTDSGWLYWAQPLLATTVVDGSNPELESQTTDHIIDEVELKLQPTGVWEYTIKATLEAMDVELQGYKEEGAWNDIDTNHPIYDLFIVPLAINNTNFPDEAFCTWIMINVPEAIDGFLTQAEINKIVNLNISNQGITDVTGLEYFTNLTNLDVSKNQLGYLDVSALTKLNKTSEANFKYNPQYQADGITTLLQDNDSENIKEWHVPQFDEQGNLLFNEHNFPDPEFRKYLETNGGAHLDDYDPNYIVGGKITKTNLDEVKMINVNGRSIIDLRGIEHFQNLEQLRVAAMPKLANLDISKNEELIELQVHGNLSLSSLDVSNNRKLITIYAHSNPSLTSIKLGLKPALTSLQIHKSQLSSLDISGCTILNKAGWNFNTYNPQLKEDGSEKSLMTPTPLTSSTNLLEWK